MAQLVFQWGLSGPNASPGHTWVPTAGTTNALQALHQAGQQGGIICLYGPTGVGKSHLLALAQEAYPALTLADNLDTLTPAGQEALFHAANRIRAEGGALLTASRHPVAQLPLLADLKSRLLTGHHVELTLPTDAELHSLLAGWAAARQIRLPDHVATYMLARAERNPHTLATLIARLDTLSLAQKRAVTIPLAKELGI